MAKIIMMDSVETAPKTHKGQTKQQREAEEFITMAQKAGTTGVIEPDLSSADPDKRDTVRGIRVRLFQAANRLNEAGAFPAKIEVKSWEKGGKVYFNVVAKVVEAPAATGEGAGAGTPAAGTPAATSTEPAKAGK